MKKKDSSDCNSTDLIQEKKKDIQVEFTNCSKRISLIQIIKYTIKIQFFESSVCVRHR